MTSNHTLIGILIFAALIVGANVIMYFIARSWAGGGKSNWMTMFHDAISKPPENKSEQAMDELHRQVDELQRRKNDG